MSFAPALAQAFRSFKESESLKEAVTFKVSQSRSIGGLEASESQSEVLESLRQSCCCQVHQDSLEGLAGQSTSTEEAPELSRFKDSHKLESFTAFADPRIIEQPIGIDRGIVLPTLRLRGEGG